jgi:hypothetical protein
MGSAYGSNVLKRLLIPLALVAAIVVAAATARQHTATRVPQPSRSLQFHSR